MTDLTDLYEIGIREDYCMYIRRIVAIEDFEIDGLKSSWKIDLEGPYEERSEKLPRGLSAGPISIGWYTLARAYDSFDDLPTHIQRMMLNDSVALRLFKANLRRVTPSKRALESLGENNGCFTSPALFEESRIINSSYNLKSYLMEVDDGFSEANMRYTVEWSEFRPDFTIANSIFSDTTATGYYTSENSLPSSCTPGSESSVPSEQRGVVVETFHLPINRTEIGGCDQWSTGSSHVSERYAMSSEDGSTERPWDEFLTEEALGNRIDS